VTNFVTSAEAWRERVITQHLAEADKHDDACEWRAGGFFLCNCAKRSRLASGLTTVPDLVMQDPFCSHCGGDCPFDGESFTCHTCHASWERPEEPGQWTDDHGDLTADLAKWEACR